ncbi:MAG: PepSY domain-containing protein, partial [Erysipelotrichaceae bacterium]|nr:PepSY domain-containing protein [Erysipelotrichaceae bacterium]
QIALDEAGVKESDVTMKEAYPKIENGNKHYKFEFIYGETEYEVEVDAISGAVVDFEKDSIYD